MDLLHHYIGAVDSKSFPASVMNFMQVLIQKRTYYADGVLTNSESCRIKFRKSGIPQDITRAHQKMFIINNFFLKTFLADVFCQPEQHLAEFVVNGQSRL